MNSRNKQIFYERYAVNDYRAGRMQAYADKLSAEDKHQIEKIIQRNNKFLEKHPFSRVKPAFTPYLEQKRPPRDKLLKKSFAFPAFACLAVLIFSLVILENRGTRVKGAKSCELIIYKQVAGDDAVPVEDSSTVKAGDRLQVAYRAGTKKYGAIISIDGNRNITYHFPRLPGEAAELSPGGEEILLPYSCVLDAAPRFELFLFVSSNRSFTLSEVESKLTSIQKIEKSDLSRITEWDIKRILLIKEEL